MKWAIKIYVVSLGRSCCGTVVLSDKDSEVLQVSDKSRFQFSMEKDCDVLPWLRIALLNIFIWVSFFLFSSNCPSFLAAALARATSDEVLQSDLSALYLPKHVDNADGIIRTYISAQQHAIARLVHLSLPVSFFILSFIFL